eukprot:1196331-Prorocentrum_minimum.AAC.1
MPFWDVSPPARTVDVKAAHVSVCASFCVAVRTRRLVSGLERCDQMWRRGGLAGPLGAAFHSRARGVLGFSPWREAGICHVTFSGGDLHPPEARDQRHGKA